MEGRYTPEDIIVKSSQTGAPLAAAPCPPPFDLVLL
ncbi:hypothetical protein PF004_g23113 [Phytophthora fragariae]|uniref:Uncharacterized protein n=1 Tax=Phytophthora fragariae TaxID=53985 RepID=A0A6G0MZI9_9STRA|nr:hypothetical protein PF004_g23113 [Phytophthora fragariae]